MRDALSALVAALEEVRADWYLFGAQAALLHGSTRLTEDIDVTAWVEDRAALVSALRKRGITVREDDPEFVERTRVLALVHDETGWDIDLVFAAPGLEDQVLARSYWLDLDGFRVRVASPEDIVVLKCLAGRDKDHHDVVAILAARGDTLDLGYVRELLAVLREALAEDEIIRFFDDAWASARKATSKR
jgi:hypothetical protein